MQGEDLMSLYTLKNDFVLVEIDEYASEIHHFQSLATGLEYMWQGDPKYWQGRNPTLFPMVGKTWQGYLLIKGQKYQMNNHGFARHSQFHCIQHDDHHLIMELNDSEETWTQYPYHFNLQIDYQLVNKKLCINYAIKNNSLELMPFHFGLHPAFNWPIDENDNPDDYRLELSHPEMVNGHLTTSLKLDREALAKTIILTAPQSTYTKLSNGRHFVKVEHPHFPWLAFWSPHAPFVCIEPWYSHTDFKANNLAFDKREGCITLDIDETWKCSYSIEID